MEQVAIPSYYYATSNSLASSTSLAPRQSYVLYNIYIFPLFSCMKAFKNPFHKSILFVVSTLIGLQQVMYQGSNKNPFKTHTKTMSFAFCAILIYFLAYCEKLTFSVGRFSTASVARHCMVWSGNFMVASLASIFAPDSFRPLFYAVALLISASELMRWLYKKIMDGSWRELYYRIISWCFSRIFIRMARDSLRGRATILPIVDPYSVREWHPLWLSRGLRFWSQHRAS